MKRFAAFGLVLCLGLTACGGPAAEPTPIPTAIPVELPTQPPPPTSGPAPGDPGYPIPTIAAPTPLPEGYPLPEPTIDPYPVPSEGASEDVLIQIGAPFQLQIGQTALLENSTIGVRFNQVLEENRCPANATCIQSGSAAIEVALNSSAGLVETIVLATDGDLAGRPSFVETEAGTLRLINLEPYPGTYQDTAPPPPFITLVLEP